jgi:hypothetical protein
MLRWFDAMTLYFLLDQTTMKNAAERCLQTSRFKPTRSQDSRQPGDSIAMVSGPMLAAVAARVCAGRRCV